MPFSGQVELSTELIQKNLAETVPLSKTMNEEMSRLRSWASRPRTALRRQDKCGSKKRGHERSSSDGPSTEPDNQQQRKGDVL